MAMDSRRHGRRRRDKLSRATRTTAAGATARATSVDDMPDHLLEEILLRLVSSACLVRAAYTCKRWRRIVTGASFLASFRALHGAHHVAGHYHTVDAYYGESALPDGENSVFVPSSSLAGVDSRHFSLDFLPESDSWELADSRGSLLLAKKRTCATGSEAQGCHFPDLIVCEPLTRRYQRILSPAHLRRHQCLGVFLLDGGDDRVDMSNFKVLCAIYIHYMPWYTNQPGEPLASVFTSGSDGGWRLPQSAVADEIELPGWFDSMNFVGRANGSYYWGIDGGEDGAMLVLDKTTTEFSLLTFPENIREFSYDKRTFRIIIGGDGDLRVLRVIGIELKVFAQHAGGGGDWTLEKLVRLQEATRDLPGREERFFQQGEAMIVTANAEYVLLTPVENSTWLFSVELETMKVERFHERNKYAGAAYPCELPWQRALQAAESDHIRGPRRRR